MLNLLLQMTSKEIKARYKNAFLGFLWIFLNPLFQMAVIGFVFQNFIKFPVDNYFLFLFPGLLIWNFFSYSLTKATSSIVFERSLIQKAKFNREIIPLSIVLSNFFHFLISLILFIIFIFLSNNHQLTINNLIYLLTSIFWFLSLTSGLSLITSSLNVKYRDINFFIQALIVLWFYATPIIYPYFLIPNGLNSFLYFNPLSYPLELFRAGLLSTSLPPHELLLPNLVLSLIIVFLGVFVFKQEDKYFSDWL